MTPDRTRMPQTHAIEHLTISGLRTLTLDNGMPLHVLDRGHDEVNKLIAIRAGGLAEAPTQTVANLTAQLLCDGSATHNAEEIADIVEFNGSWINAIAHTHHMSLNMISINSRFDHVAPIMAEIWHEPTFPDKSFKVKQAMLAKKIEEMRLKVATLADEEAARIAMGRDNPLAKAITAAEVHGTSVKDLRDFYRATSTGAPTTLYVGGRITPAIEDRINDTFGGLPYEPKPQDSGLRITPFTDTITSWNDDEVRDERKQHTVHIPVNDALQSGVTLVLPAVGRSHEDYIPLRLTVLTLGGYFGSRLMSNIREDKGYTYGITANLMGYLDGSYTQISCECDHRYVEPLIDETLRELREMVTRPVENEELMRVRQSVTSSLLSIIDTPFTTLGYYTNMQFVGTPKDYFHQLLEASRTIDADTIARMASKYLNPDNARIVIAGR